MSLFRSIIMGALFLAPVITSAAIIVPGANGTDGALNITTNTVIDLSLAVTAVWDSDNTANIGKGVYDSNKWAVVFKYTSVNVATGATVTFKNHPSRAPVVWLVSGDVTIGGTVSLNGQHRVNAPALAEPGPGGFRGGAGYYNSNVGPGAGYGVGGGRWEAGASYLQAGENNNVPQYGNPSLIPLIGGSGGGGGKNTSLQYRTGGGGGGALFVCCESVVNIAGTIESKGGEGHHNGNVYQDGSGGGSGGAIRIVCSELHGNGRIDCSGGFGQKVGSLGRIRVERIVNNSALQLNPAPSIVDLASGTTAILWPPDGSPEVRIISIGGNEAPADPRAAFGTFGADVALPVTTQAVVLVETINVETQSQVRVRITPRDTFNASVHTATYHSTIDEDPLKVHWQANVPANLGYSAVQVQVIRP